MDDKRCVCCGAPLDWQERLVGRGSGDPAAWAGWQRREFSAFGAGAVASVPAGVEYERRRPVRSAAVESDVVTPVLQSAISGSVVGVVASVVAVVASVPRPVLIGIGIGAGVLAVTWGVLLGEHRRLLWEVERVTGRDWDGDGVAGDPVVSDPVVSDPDPNLIYVRDPARMRRRERAKDFRFWLREAYGERGTTWREWDGVRLPSGEVVTRPVWEQYTERLQRAGLAERAYTTAPLETVGSYRDALETFAEVL